jgi:hypothetical protein
VSASLATIIGARRLRSLTLMMGALRAPSSGVAAAAAPAAADVAAALAQLPCLSDVSLVGLAGGLDARDPAASAALVLELSRRLAGGLERVALEEWGEGELAAFGRLLPCVREAAPDLLVTVRSQWAG